MYWSLLSLAQVGGQQAASISATFIAVSVEQVAARAPEPVWMRREKNSVACAGI